MAETDSTADGLTCCVCGNALRRPKNWTRLSIWRRLKPRRCKWCVAAITRKHGMTHTRIWNIWFGMLTRCGHRKCSNPAAFKYYINKGIRVCDEWHDFPTFARWAFANGYDDDLTIDRKDAAQGYSPDNCRWVTMAENLRNNRRCKKRA